MQNKNLKDLLNIFKKREFNFWQTNIENDEEMEINIKLGKIKDMSKNKVTLTKLHDMMVLFIEETRQNFNKVNNRLDRLEKDVALIKSCPTIKKEIAELNSSK